MPVVFFDLLYGGIPFLIMMVIAIIISVKEWNGMAKLSSSYTKDLAFGVIYICIGFCSFSIIRLFYDGGEWLAIALLLSVWASDTGAYFFGKTFKGPKMAPLISPNKTWAGFIGGGISSAMAFMLCANIVCPKIAEMMGRDFAFAGFDGMFWALLFIGASITLSGQAGDLLISAQKRKVGVKDTGNLIPGHGGLLDRIDSLLMSSIVFLLTIFVLSL